MTEASVLAVSARLWLLASAQTQTTGSPEAYLTDFEKPETLYAALRHFVDFPKYWKLSDNKSYSEGGLDYR